MKSQNILDCNGKVLKSGDKVIYISVEETLLSGLPEDDQIAIKAQKNKEHIITAIDDRGYLEIEFEHMRPDSEVSYHTIWAAPQCFRLVEK